LFQPGVLIQVVVESEGVDGLQVLVVLDLQNLQTLQVVEGQGLDVLKKSRIEDFD